MVFHERDLEVVARARETARMTVQELYAGEDWRYQEDRVLLAKMFDELSRRRLVTVQRLDQCRMCEREKAECLFPEKRAAGKVAYCSEFAVAEWIKQRIGEGQHDDAQQDA